MNWRLFIYLAITVLVTNAVRVVPVTIIRRPITNRFLKSFLYYVPYVTLAVMTFPAICTAAGTPLAGAAALVAGIIAAWCGLGLFQVSAVCCITAFVLQML